MDRHLRNTQVAYYTIISQVTDTVEACHFMTVRPLFGQIVRALCTKEEAMHVTVSFLALELNGVPAEMLWHYISPAHPPV